MLQKLLCLFNLHKYEAITNTWYYSDGSRYTHNFKECINCSTMVEYDNN